MDRKRTVEAEHRYQRAKVPQNLPVDPFVVTEEELTAETKFPWEKRGPEFGDFRDLIARKPNVQNRYEMLI